jgi:hypothetical protein
MTLNETSGIVNYKRQTPPLCIKHDIKEMISILLYNQI